MGFLLSFPLLAVLPALSCVRLLYVTPCNPILEQCALMPFSGRNSPPPHPTPRPAKSAIALAVIAVSIVGVDRSNLAPYRDAINSVFLSFVPPFFPLPGISSRPSMLDQRKLFAFPGIRGIPGFFERRHSVRRSSVPSAPPYQAVYRRFGETASFAAGACTSSSETPRWFRPFMPSRRYRP